MSLFENDEYQWRETYFVLFDAQRRPKADIVENALRELNAGYELRDVRAAEDGDFESLTLISQDDYAAMDLSCVVGEEVQDQVVELAKELKTTAAPDELPSIERIPKCTARLEVYHFEQLVFTASTGEDDEPDDFMDPGSLLVVLDRLAQICDGIVVDPQSNSIL